MNDWISVKTSLPKQGEIVDTKIDDELNGERNIAQLRLIGNLWFHPEDSLGRFIYIYYNPTHWRPVK